MFCPPQPLRFWITPACAGKRGRKEVAPMSNRDHPRVCGEKRSVKALLSAVMESPPHVRGKAGHPVTRRAYRGITPAYAGKSRPQKAPHTAGRDHPRVCGEKLRIVEVGRVKEGSPPRVRGKVPSISRPAPASGITPACAGKSCPPQAPTFTRQDHTRVCGEKCPPGKFFFMTVGSPPRVRGKALPAHACPAA